MKRLSLITLLSLLAATPAWAAVAFVTHAAATPANSGTTPLTINITVSGTNPVVGISVGHGTTVSSVSWSLGGGEALSQIKTATSAANYVTEVWCLAAPTAGAGTISVTFSAPTDYQADAWVFQGGATTTTTACPLADAVSSIDQTPPKTLTPGSLTANDASVGAAASGDGNPTGVTPTQDFLNSSTNINLESGHASGTTGVTFAGDASWANINSEVVIRIAATAAAGNKAGPLVNSPILKGLVGGGLTQ